MRVISLDEDDFPLGGLASVDVAERAQEIDESLVAGEHFDVSAADAMVLVRLQHGLEE